LLNTAVDEYARMCDCKITLSGEEITHEFDRKLPSLDLPTD